MREAIKKLLLALLGRINHQTTEMAFPTFLDFPHKLMNTIFTVQKEYTALHIQIKCTDEQTNVERTTHRSWRELLPAFNFETFKGMNGIAILEFSQSWNVSKPFQEEFWVYFSALLSLL